MNNIFKSGLMCAAVLSFSAQAESIVETVLSPFHTATGLVMTGSLSTSATTIETMDREVILNAVPDSLDVLDGAEASPLFLEAIAVVEANTGLIFLSNEEAALEILDIASQL